MDETKPCPYCGEPIQKVARKCKWCGEWLDKESPSEQPTYIKCPICGEQIPVDSKVCPLCNEPVSESKPKPPVPPKISASPSTKKNKLPLYIIGGVVAVILLIVGGVEIKSYLNDRENQERIANNPYEVISKNLDAAIANGETLSTFVRDEKNVAALKEHFGEDVYSLILELSSYSDTPLAYNDGFAGGFAWRSAGDVGEYGCRLYLNQDKFGCEYRYEGLDVDQYGNIVRNDHWKCDYYNDDFNEDDTTKPYIEQAFSMEGDRGICSIRLDNIYGVIFTFSDVYYFDQILLRNNDTGEVWNVPITKVAAGQAVLLKDGQEQFVRWFNTATSIKLSAIDSTGQYDPLTVTMDGDEMKFYNTFVSHVMKKNIDSDIFVKHDFN